MGLRELLMGGCLSTKTDCDRLSESLNGHLLGLIDLLPRVYGDTDACRQAVLEVGTLVDMGMSKRCIACKRAMLLYAIATESEISSHWSGSRSDGSSAMAKDLSERVMPFLVPRFFKHSCQAPEAFVVMSLILSEMWRGERLGNFSCSP